MDGHCDENTLGQIYIASKNVFGQKGIKSKRFCVGPIRLRSNRLTLGPTYFSSNVFCVRYTLGQIDIRSNRH
jgi:hypothetical protein